MGSGLVVQEGMEVSEHRAYTHVAQLAGAKPLAARTLPGPPFPARCPLAGIGVQDGQTDMAWTRGAWPWPEDFMATIACDAGKELAQLALSVSERDLLERRRVTQP